MKMKACNGLKNLLRIISSLHSNTRMQNIFEKQSDLIHQLYYMYYLHNIDYNLEMCLTTALTINK